MTEIQTRYLKFEYDFEKDILHDKNVVNYSITQTRDAYEAVLEVFQREVQRDPEFLTFYDVEDQSDAFILLLVFHTFEAEKYFEELTQV